MDRVVNSFYFHSAKSTERTHLFKVKYVVYPPAKVVLDFTELFPAKNIYEELDINNVCELNKLD